MNKNTIRWHTLAWVGFYIYSFVDEFLDYSGSTTGHKIPLRQALWLTASFLTVRLIVFYFCYLIVYPRFLRVGRLPQLMVGIGAAVLLFAGVRGSIEEALFPALLGFRNYAPGTTIQHYIGNNFFWSIPTLILSALLWASAESMHQERENRQLREEKRAAETAFLKTQINPHFLFNTLNLLYGMAYPVSKPLAAALLKLAELMRYMLHETASDQVALTREIEYVQHYLALYRLRFPDQLFVDFSVTGEPTGRQIAPLVLIPFVENALKHGVLDDPAYPVRIQLHVAAQEVVFQVGNRISDQQKDTTSGIGLPNLRRRLALRYPGRHHLHIAADKGQFDTLLRVAC